jgi:hypothetical protein
LQDELRSRSKLVFPLTRHVRRGLVAHPGSHAGAAGRPHVVGHRVQGTEAPLVKLLVHDVGRFLPEPEPRRGGASAARVVRVTGLVHRLRRRGWRLLLLLGGSSGGRGHSRLRGPLPQSLAYATVRTVGASRAVLGLEYEGPERVGHHQAD